MKIKNIQIRADGETRLDEVIFEIYDDADRFVAKQGIGGLLQSLGDNPSQQTIIARLSTEAKSVVKQIEDNNTVIQLINNNALLFVALPAEIEFSTIPVDTTAPSSVPRKKKESTKNIG